jgi:hypothetical protein
MRCAAFPATFGDEKASSSGSQAPMGRAAHPDEITPGEPTRQRLTTVGQPLPPSAFPAPPHHQPSRCAQPLPGVPG